MFWMLSTGWSWPARLWMPSARLREFPRSSVPSNSRITDPANDPHAPDLIVFAEEGCAFGNTSNGEQPFTGKVELLGTHGHDSTLPHLHATFVACGYGIKSGTVLGEISNTSVAPTIAELLQFHLPDTDGMVLNSILAK